LVYDQQVIAILFPRFDHDAIEERYASWQSRMLLQREPDIEFALYDPDEPASAASGLVTSSLALVITDPLLLPPERLASRLHEVLERTPTAAAAVPVSNEASKPEQRRAPSSPYLTLNEMETVMRDMRTNAGAPMMVTWDDSDPGVFAMSTDLLDTIKELPRHALKGRQVAISPADYVHRWISMRAKMRDDLLDFVPVEARSMIELGCGEGALGQAVKARQRARVVGVELDRAAAAIARKRIDDVYQGDVEEIVSLLHEKFDCIVASEIIEHVVDPWSLLGELRRIAAPGGQLILSIPNLAHASIINDLLEGRFDYAYIGLTCVGHLRFFTRRSIEEMLRIAGWVVLEITAQQQNGMAAEELLRRLNPPPSNLMREDLTATGFYVVARNPR
jgi:2-polyprenyl-3-methyl-5-hydroxy-6-metoxy-1,4-benzoquinol methylase